MRPTSRRQAALYVFVVALAFYWIAINATGRGFLAWYRLACTGLPATATITATDPGNHQRCRYAYQVDGRTMSGSDSGCAQAGVGAALAITYLPTDPTFATTQDPASELECEVFGPLALSCLGAVVAAARFKDQKIRRA